MQGRAWWRRPELSVFNLFTLLYYEYLNCLFDVGLIRGSPKDRRCPSLVPITAKFHFNSFPLKKLSQNCKEYFCDFCSRIVSPRRRKGQGVSNALFKRQQIYHGRLSELLYTIYCIKHNSPTMLNSDCTLTDSFTKLISNVNKMCAIQEAGNLLCQ